jgi:hypothetical protein
LKPAPEIAVVVPVHNEAENIAPRLAEIDAALGTLTDYEVIFVDDGSTDATPRVLVRGWHTYPRRRFLPALYQRAGARVISVPIRHRPRTRGRSHYSLHDRLWVGLADLLGVLWLTRRMLITDCLDLAASGSESGDNPPGEARPQRPAGGTHA